VVTSSLLPSTSLPGKRKGDQNEDGQKKDIRRGGDEERATKQASQSLTQAGAPAKEEQRRGKGGQKTGGSKEVVPQPLDTEAFLDLL
jgi:hypothetical protein